MVTLLIKTETLTANVEISSSRLEDVIDTFLGMLPLAGWHIDTVQRGIIEAAEAIEESKQHETNTLAKSNNCVTCSCGRVDTCAMA